MSHELSDGPDDDIIRLAREWFGYGSWAARYWFVGMEPGGDELPANLRMWAALDHQPLIDIQAYSEPGDADWFGDVAKPQFTWSRLIWLLLAYKGEEATPSATLRYQRLRLARAGDETALIELSAISTPSSNTDEARRSWFRNHRIATIQNALRDRKPRFVVFYSTTLKYREAWKEIVGVELSEGQPIGVGETVCVMAGHPRARPGHAYWSELGRRLAAFPP